MDVRQLDALDLYERTVQDPERAVGLLRGLHGGAPRVLGEDFAGSAALSRAWVRAVDDGRAIAVDLDRASLERAPHPRVATHVLDARSAELARLGPCDVVHAGNFSLGELHARAELLRWARTARARLRPDGIVAADTYGGESAWRTGALERRRFEAGGVEIRWMWEQRRADALTGAVVNALSFRVLRGGEVVREFPDAFVYRWRLWSVPELVDAFGEAGFGRVYVHTRADPPGAEPVAVRGASAVEHAGVALVIGRK